MNLKAFIPSLKGARLIVHFVSPSDAYARLESMGWSPGDGSAALMLIVGSQHACGNFTAEFRDLEIY